MYVFMTSIENLRKSRGWKSCQVAQWLGLSPSSYCDKEKGRRRFTAAEAAKLCALFEVGIGEVEDFNETVLYGGGE